MNQPLEAEIAAAVRAFPQFTMSAELLPAMRRPAPPAPAAEGVVRTDHTLPGEPPVRVRVHRPAGIEGIVGISVDFRLAPETSFPDRSTTATERSRGSTRHRQHRRSSAARRPSDKDMEGTWSSEFSSRATTRAAR